MKYVSTRGAAPAADFETVLTAGLAPDGGLYVPETFPRAEEAAPSAYPQAAAHTLKKIVLAAREQGGRS